MSEKRKIDLLKFELQKDIKVIYTQTKGVGICDKVVNVAKLIKKYAPVNKKLIGIPITESYKIFDFERLENYNKNINIKNEKMFNKTSIKIKTFELEFLKFQKYCDDINLTIMDEKNKYSKVLKTNLRLIKKQDIKTIMEAVQKKIENLLKNINMNLMAEMLVELKSNLKTLIRIQLKKYDIESSEDLEYDLEKITNDLTPEILIKDNINFNLDLILDISEEFIINEKYYNVLLELVSDNHEILNKVETLKKNY